MRDNLLVTIIVPAYNVEDYLEDCINSLCNQTYNTLEIIIIDDGSTDKTFQICESYKNCGDPRVKVIHKANGGLSSARNTGLNIFKGDYVVFVDGDDRLVPNAIELLVKTMEEHPADLIQYKYKLISNQEEILNIKLDESIKYINTINDKKDIIENLYKLGGIGASSCTKFFKGNLFNNLRFNEHIIHEDEDLCTKLFEKDLTITYIDNELYLYIRRDNSITTSSFNINKLDVFKVILDRIDFLEKNNLSLFISFEYQRLFTSVIVLSKAIMQTNNNNYLKEIERVFYKQKNNIKKYNNFTFKHKIIFFLLCINFKFIYLIKIGGK